MEPISASLANSSAFTTDPFTDDATTFIFGNGNEVGGATDATTTTPTATAATSSGSGASNAGSYPGVGGGSTGGAASPAPAGSPIPFVTILFIGLGGFLLLHFLHK